LRVSELWFIIVGLAAPVTALWVWKSAAHRAIAEPGLPPLGVAIVGGGVRRRRGPRRRDEGRL
jgi:hypothetical protein